MYILYTKLRKNEMYEKNRSSLAIPVEITN